MDVKYIFKEQAKDITKIKSVMKQQLSKTDQVIASQEAVAEVFREVSERLNDDLSASFSSMSGVLQEICYVAENGFREIADRLDLQNETLAEIREILKRPLDTQAKELRIRAENAYLNGWIDEAELDLLEAEKKNYQDFFIHGILGNIYFFYRKNYPEALKYYGKAAKYASPISKEFSSKAYLSMGMTYFETKAIQDAYMSSRAALNISPEDEDVLYTHAVFSANAGHMDEFIDCLQKSILKDPRYLILADTDTRLSFCREDIHQLARRLRDDEKQKIRNLKAEMQSTKQELSAMGIEDVSNAIAECITEVDRLASADNYLDCLVGRTLAFNTHLEATEKASEGKKALGLIDKAKSIFSLLTKDAYSFGLLPDDFSPLQDSFEKVKRLTSHKTHEDLKQAASIISEAMRQFYREHNQKIKNRIGSLQSEISQTASKGYGCLGFCVGFGVYLACMLLIFVLPQNLSGAVMGVGIGLGVLIGVLTPQIIRNSTTQSLQNNIAVEKEKQAEVSSFFAGFE